MSSIPPHCPLWIEFFSELSQLPVLWKVKSDCFKDKNKKRRAWPKLLECYKKIEPDANIDSLKKRLTNIKSCYRRELKKVDQSLRSGAGGEEEYVPILWYFSELEFLRDQEVQMPGISFMDLDQNEGDIEEAEEAVEADFRHVPPTSTTKRKNSTAQHIAERNDILRDALDRLSQERRIEEDDASVFAAGWAVSFRKLSSVQQIYAKKAIEDILVLGQLNLLTLDSVCLTNNQSQRSGPSPSQTRHTPMPQPPSSGSSSTSSSLFSSPSLSFPILRNMTLQPATSQPLTFAAPVELENATYSSIGELFSDNEFS